jgi:hypothetical protein
MIFIIVYMARTTKMARSKIVAYVLTIVLDKCIDNQIFVNLIIFEFSSYHTSVGSIVLPTILYCTANCIYTTVHQQYFHQHLYALNMR